MTASYMGLLFFKQLLAGRVLVQWEEWKQPCLPHPQSPRPSIIIKCSTSSLKIKQNKAEELKYGQG
jgi:hypothetical protein